ncbi:MAG: hypothetical protein ABEJ86_04200 [Halococcoides sp.]
MDIDTGTLLKVVLGLAIVWLVVMILDTVLDWFGFLFGLTTPILGLLVLIAVALFVYDRFL